MKNKVLYGFFVFSVIVNASDREVFLPLTTGFEDKDVTGITPGKNTPVNTPVEELENAKICLQGNRILTAENFASERLYTVGRFAVRASPYTDQELFKAKKKEAENDRNTPQQKSYDEQDLDKVSKQFEDALKVAFAKIDCIKPADFFKTESEDGL